jgi:DNA replication protein DnaC
VQILLIDDIGKGKMTDRAEMELFDLLETRTSHKLPTIWTANAKGDDLLRMMSEDRGEPIIRRLSEFSEIV